MNPVASEADDQVNVLHVAILPRDAPLVPIEQRCLFESFLLSTLTPFGFVHE